MKVAMLSTGVSVPAEVVQLAMTLESRGVRFIAERTDVLLVRAANLITPAELDRVKQLRDELRIYAEHQAPAL
jgi:hypothetical protein